MNSRHSGAEQISRWWLRQIEPAIYTPRGQRISLGLLLIASAAMLWQAVQIRPSASFEKNVPREHPQMQVLRQYQDDFGGANTVLVALLQDTGDIYNRAFLQSLRTATTELSFIPGIDRTRVSSLFTRNVSFIEVDEQGFAGDNVIPPDYAPSATMFEQIRLNVSKAGLVGHLVSLDQRGAMISAEVLERDPVSGETPDLIAIAAALERQIRLRLTSPHRYLLRASRDLPGFAAGETVLERFSPPAWWHPLQTYSSHWIDGSGQRHERTVPGRWLTVEKVANPDYQSDLSVHILGFPSIVGAVAAASTRVALFFLLTVVATMLVLRGYLGSWRLALLPLACSLLAVVWEFGLLRALGFGLDPFAILVPFLVLAVSTSHGVQYVNRWADELAAGASAAAASQATFRRLFIPGSIALLTNIAGFLTIALVPIGVLQEMAINACLGMFAVLIGNKWLMPIWLCRLSLPDPDRFAARRRLTNAWTDRCWIALAKVSHWRPALLLATLAAAVAVTSWSLQTERIIGDAQAGVPELRPDSVYNRDVNAVQNNFSIGTDVLKVIAEMAPDSCISHSPLAQVDHFAWRMRNVAGVTTTITAVDVAKQVFAAMNENHPNFLVLPRNRYSLVLATTPIETSSGLLNYACDAMPVIIFAADHRATTIARISAAAEQFNRHNEREYAAEHPDYDAKACARLQRERRDGAAPAVANCPVHFALATGNLGVMGATNDVVAAAELPALIAVYLVVGLLLLASYRSLRAWLVIGIPLLLVSIFANALMAVLGIGLKVATLPVVTLAVGIGVDYGIYIYDVLHHKLRMSGMTLYQAYLDTLRETGKAVVFTGLVLAGSVASWLASDLQFQRDMGLLLVFMFSANMLGAVLLGPAIYRLLYRGS